MSYIKICGLTREEDIQIANALKPDYIGFVFAESKRKISLECARRLKHKLDSSVQIVGVFVNAPLLEIKKYEAIIDIIQLHGDEDLAYIEALKKIVHLPIIKALHMKNEKTLKLSLGEQYQFLESPNIDYILLDTHYDKGYGGKGIAFDWSLVEHIKRPYFLAGGINKDTIDKALSYQPFALDVSSGVETNGYKDREKIQEILSKIRESSR